MELNEGGAAANRSVCAIVAEYNPFHSGHAWQIQQARAAGATHIVAVMSGNFVQRGAPALMDKWIRAQAALLCGVDLVLELALPYAISGAQRFAAGAAATLNALGKVDTLCFGSECGSLPRLLRTRDVLLDPRLPEELGRRMSGGVTFARARQEAVCALAGEEAGALLSGPNDTLGLEYLMAAQKLGAGWNFLCIPRAGAGHHSRDAVSGFCSAGALRERILAHGADAAAPFVPARALELYRTAPLAAPQRLEAPALSQLRRMAREEFALLPELSEGLENRLYQAVRQAATLEELYAGVKTKRYTHARVRRLVLAAFLGVRDAWTRQPPPYLRVLGFTPRGRTLLEGESAVPLGASLRRLSGESGQAAVFAQLEAAAGDQFALLQSPAGPCGRDFRAPVLRAGQLQEPEPEKRRYNPINTGAETCNGS